MKSFKVLTLLLLGATLSCYANGSPVTPDGLVKRQSKDELTAVIKSIPNIAQKAYTGKNMKRAAFNKAVIFGLLLRSKHYNYVICIPAHEYAFEGVQGVDWDHYKIKKDSTTYDIVVGGAGIFRFLGKDDYTNNDWAWTGAVVPNQNPRSNVIQFVDHGTGGHQLGSLFGNQTWVETEAQ